MTFMEFQLAGGGSIMIPLGSAIAIKREDDLCDIVWGPHTYETVMGFEAIVEEINKAAAIHNHQQREAAERAQRMRQLATPPVIRGGKR